MTIEAKDRVFVTLGKDQPFPATVAEVRGNWLRLIGKGSVDGCIFDQWFPANAKEVTIKKAKL